VLGKLELFVLQLIVLRKTLLRWC